MSLIHAIAQLCALCTWSVQSPATVPASDQPTECRRDEGYAPAPPFASGGAIAPATTAPAFFQPNSNPPAAAWYAEAAHKTFFAYLAAEPTAAGAAGPGRPIRVSFFDHATGTVPKPAILPFEPGHDGVTSLSLVADEQGCLWLCVGLSAHRPASLFKSTKPYDISAFTQLPGPALDVPRFWHVLGQGFISIGLRNEGDGPAPYFATSPDGQTWSEGTKLAALGAGHTFIAARHLNKIGVALAAYSAGEGPASATSIYYVETSDAGKTWQSIQRMNLPLPVTGQEPDVRRVGLPADPLDGAVRGHGFHYGRPPGHPLSQRASRAARQTAGLHLVNRPMDPPRLGHDRPALGRRPAGFRRPVPRTQERLAAAHRPQRPAADARACGNRLLAQR